MDKFALASIALRERIATPRTLSCSSQTEVAEAAKQLEFPVVMKPRSAHEWRKSGMWQAVGARKAIQVNNPTELQIEYSALPAAAADVLVQEYVPGDDNEIVVCCCYMDTDGTMLGQFTGRKLRQSPPLFGTGCIVEAVEVPSIVDVSRRLLKACGYAGIAEVEFKRNFSTGEYMLIEVNARHWDQHALGMLVGVNLSWVAYQRALGQYVLPVAPRYPSYRAPRWIAERELLMALVRDAAADHFSRTPYRLMAIGRAAAETVSQMARLVRRPVTFPILDLRDPVPGVLLIFRILRELAFLARRGAFGKR
jgi:predicted ATP-grasp superfamily ATP-dependent carboligase